LFTVSPFGAGALSLKLRILLVPPPSMSRALERAFLKDAVEAMESMVSASSPSMFLVL